MHRVLPRQAGGLPPSCALHAVLGGLGGCVRVCAHACLVATGRCLWPRLPALPALPAALVPRRFWLHPSGMYSGAEHCARAWVPAAGLPRAGKATAGAGASLPRSRRISCWKRPCSALARGARGLTGMRCVGMESCHPPVWKRAGRGFRAHPGCPLEPRAALQARGETLCGVMLSWCDAARCDTCCDAAPGPVPQLLPSAEHPQRGPSPVGARGVPRPPCKAKAAEGAVPPGFAKTCCPPLPAYPGGLSGPEGGAGCGTRSSRHASGPTLTLFHACRSQRCPSRRGTAELWGQAGPRGLGATVMGACVPPRLAAWAAAVARWSQAEARRDPRCRVAAAVGAGRACALPHCYAGFVTVRLMLVIGLGVLSPECFLLAAETNFSPDLLPGK